MSGHFSLSKTNDNKVIFNIDGIFIVCDDEVKLNFNSHVANICKNAAMQLNVLKRIGKHLDSFGNLLRSLVYYI